MKPATIIVIAVFCSVVAVFAVIEGMDRYDQSQAQRYDDYVKLSTTLGNLWADKFFWCYDIHSENCTKEMAEKSKADLYKIVKTVGYEDKFDQLYDEWIKRMDTTIIQQKQDVYFNYNSNQDKFDYELNLSPLSSYMIEELYPPLFLSNNELMELKAVKISKEIRKIQTLDYSKLDYEIIYETMKNIVNSQICSDGYRVITITVNEYDYNNDKVICMKTSSDPDLPSFVDNKCPEGILTCDKRIIADWLDWKNHGEIYYEDRQIIEESKITKPSIDTSITAITRPASEQNPEPDTLPKSCPFNYYGVSTTTNEYDLNHDGWNDYDLNHDGKNDYDLNNDGYLCVKKNSDSTKSFVDNRPEIPYIVQKKIDSSKIPKCGPEYGRRCP